MKQITEDYVSYEIAQLLKEKGFDENCHAIYDLNTKQIDIKNVGNVFNNEQWENYISAPSQSLALKWLREVHKINIVINVASDDDNLYSLWKFDIWNGNYSIIWGDKREKFNSYEQAVEATLLYVLKNLI